MSPYVVKYMRHSIIAFLFFVFAFVGCGNPDSDKNESPQATDASLNDIPATALREKFADNPDMENVIVNDAQGVLSAQGTLLNGKKEGTWTEFNSNGTVKTIMPYILGKREGLYVELNSSGQFIKRISYHNNLRHGRYIEYIYPVKKEERTYQEGKLEGSVKIYYPDGKIMEEGSYKNDTRDGISRWYDNAGKVTIEYEYKHGELVKK